MGATENPKPALLTEAQEQLTLAYTLAREKPEEALQACKAAIEMAPESAEAYNLKGILLEEVGAPQQSLEAYQMAVQLAPDFEDAHRNLLELQEELLETQYQGKKPPARKVAFWGAIVCGGLFAGTQGAHAFVGEYVDIPFVVAVLGMCGYAASCGIGVYAIGVLSKFKKTLQLSLFGAFGCAIAYGITAIASSVPHQMSGPAMYYSAPLFSVKVILRYVVIGIGAGAMLGIVQKTSRQLGFSILAGLISFGSYGLFAPLLELLLMRWNLVPIPPQSVRLRHDHGDDYRH